MLAWSNIGVFQDFITAAADIEYASFGREIGEWYELSGILSSC